MARLDAVPMEADHHQARRSHLRFREVITKSPDSKPIGTTMLASVGRLQSPLPWALTAALLLAWSDPHRRFLLGGVSGAVVLKVLHIAMRGLCNNPLEGVYLLGSLLYAFGKTVVQYMARGFKPIFPQWTLRFELFRVFIRVGMELHGERVLGDESYAAIVREQSEWFGTFGVAGLVVRLENATSPSRSTTLSISGFGRRHHGSPTLRDSW